MELLIKDLKEVIGLGTHQVTQQTDRVERWGAVAIMVYLVLLQRQAKDIPADPPWSPFRLQRAFAWGSSRYRASI